MALGDEVESRRRRVANLSLQRVVDRVEVSPSSHFPVLLDLVQAEQFANGVVDNGDLFQVGQLPQVETHAWLQTFGRDDLADESSPKFGPLYALTQNVIECRIEDERVLTQQDRKCCLVHRLVNGENVAAEVVLAPFFARLRPRQRGLDQFLRDHEVPEDHVLGFTRQLLPWKDLLSLFCLLGFDCSFGPIEEFREHFRFETGKAFDLLSDIVSDGLLLSGNLVGRKRLTLRCIGGELHTGCLVLVCEVVAGGPLRSQAIE